MPSGRTTWHIRCSVVPQHIGVVKINTMTLFGKKDSQSSPTASISVQVSPGQVKLLGRPILASLFDLNKNIFFLNNYNKKEMTIKVKS